MHGTDCCLVVHLLFRDNLSNLGNSYDITKRNFGNNFNLKIYYTKLINEYKELVHMEQVSDEEYYISSTTWYLPHDAVLNKSCTSMRFFF